MKLQHFLILSVILHAAGVYFLQPRFVEPEIPTVQDIQLLEVAPKSEGHLQKKFAIGAPHRAAKKIETPEASTPIKESETPSADSNSESAESGGSSEPVSVGTVTEIPRVLKEKKIEYPKQAARMGIEGTVELKLLINVQGLVETAELVRGPAPSLNEAALQAIKEFVFSPAKIGDRKVPVRLIYKYRFSSAGGMK